MADGGNPEVYPEPGITPKTKRWVREKWREMWNHPHMHAVEKKSDKCEREMGALERKIFLQVDLYGDEENGSSTVKEKKRMARAALTTWIEKIEIIKHMKLQRKSEMRTIMNEVYQLVSLYSVFVGVVLTAVATSDRLECQHLWGPIGLSLFVYFMVVVVAFTKFKEIGDLEEKRAINKQKKKEIKTQVSTLMVEGYAQLKFGGHCKKEWQCERLVLFSRKSIGLIVPLTIFTAGLVFSLIHILCWS